MKKFSTFLIVAVVGLVGQKASAFDVANDDGKRISYSVLSEGAATVYVTYGGDYSGDVVIPSTVEYNSKTYTVTSINNLAFNSRSQLTSVTLPATIESVAEGAFQSCNTLEAFYGKFASSDNRCLIVDNVLVGYAPAQLTSYTIPAGVTRIGNSTFNNISWLKGITLPSSLISIGVQSFYGCSSLTSLNIPSSTQAIEVQAFSYCRGLKNLTLGASLKTIGEYAFNNCENLTAINIPNSVETIESYAFNGCTAVETLTLGNSLKSIGNCAFQDLTNISAIRIPDSVTSIGEHAFSSCESATTLEIGASVKTIDMSAFSYCLRLKEASIPDAVTTMGSYVFYNCSGLEKATFGNSLTTTGSATFKNCTSLNSVTFSSSIKEIGSESFMGCTSLKAINIPNTITTIYDNAFKESGLERVTIGDGITKIGQSAFASCKVLKDVSLGNSLKIIDKSAFYGCSALATLTFPDHVTTIGESAFYGCTALKSLTLPDNLATIGQSAFSGCSNIETIAVGNHLTSVGTQAFYDCKNLRSFSGKYASQDGRCLFITNNLVGFARKGLTHYEIPNTFYCNGVTYNILDINGDVFKDCQEIKSIKLPDSLTTISSYAFYGCSALESIDMPDTVSRLGEDCFAYCGHLASVKLSESISAIPTRAFYYCSELSKIKLSSNVTSLVGACFGNCTGLNEIYCYAINPPSCSSTSFYNNLGSFSGINKDFVTLYVPYESVDLYKEHNAWREFKNIQEIVPAKTPERLEVENLLTYKGQIETIAVNMVNTAAITGFQCDIIIPEDLTLVDTEDQDIELSSRASRTHYISYNEVESGHYKVMSYSTRSIAFAGNEGTLFTIPVEMPDHGGSYTIRIKNIVLTDTDGTQYRPDDIYSKVEVDEYEPGDANGDGEINIGDIASIIDYVLQRDNANINVSSADLNRDSEINITDIVLLINKMLNFDIPTAKIRQMGGGYFRLSDMNR